jgi:signal recognition particle receptor subunit beta
MKSPKQLSSDIRTLTRHIDQVRESLLRRTDIELAQVGKECKRASDALARLLQEQALPDHYKVAVVGRFKAGKSSFVNELLEARLASEDTNPETAAVTTFKYGEEVKANIQFLSRNDWLKIQRLYEQDPRHVDAHRLLKWHELAKPRRNKDGEVDEGFDLQALESEFIRDGGFSIEIRLANDGTKKAEVEFRRRLKEFTTGTKPHHCMVRGIEIETPAPILDGGVLLIDTPGLGDTERYRVELTERVVDDVDAVLFLTRSGASYDQAEKDFLLSLLRKGTVKQLIIVVTQVDVTYQQHLDNAEANDDEPEPVSQRIALERHRLAKELAETLAELSQENSPATRRYREQLGEVQIAFTSAKLHRDWKSGKTTPCVIGFEDPGGVEQLKQQLLGMLSTESRLATVAHSVAGGARSVLLDLQSVLDAKLIAIREVQDGEVAEQRLRGFREEFGAAGIRFESAVMEQVGLLGQRISERAHQHRSVLELIALLAERELSAFESNDLARHWRSRRHGYWGYMADFQTRVANRIFPKVQEVLSEYTDCFGDFARAFEIHVDRLSADGVRIAQSLELGATLPFDVTNKLNGSLEKSLSRAQELILAKELEVNKLLSDFVDDEVSDRIDEVREKVSDILGVGTTVNQSREVHAFYQKVKALLSDALQAYLEKSVGAFGDFLITEAQAAPRDALAEIDIVLEQAEDNIRASTTALVAGQKQATEDLVSKIKSEHSEVLSSAATLLALGQIPVELNSEAFGSNRLGSIPQPDVAAKPQRPVVVPTPRAVEVARTSEGDWAENVLTEAQVILERIRMRNGDKGWDISRVFPSRYIQGATRIRLIDGFLLDPHQLRNLGELLLHLAEHARPKEVEVLTKFSDPDATERQNLKVNELAIELFRDYGVLLTLRRQNEEHSRALVLDHGVFFRLDRGLDFFKPALGLARHRANLREVRKTEIDVFCIPGHRLLGVQGELGPKLQIA